jgi:F-box protein 9
MMHISALPQELIMAIVKWIVSSDLDILSLSQFALVCRGFYMCAMDEELWRMICRR